MLLACQQDAYARQGASTVVAVDGNDVWVDDSVLYPEGGGQPSDHGTIAGGRGTDVQRDPRGVRLRCARPVAVGVHPVEVDWPRRYDHMQQHTAQHLLTALALDRLGVATTSFHLGAEQSHIDLERALIPDEVERLFTAANAVAREGRAVRHERVDGLEGVRSRRLAEGVSELRVVSIDGVDRNTCGGTHVANTAELQLLVPLGVERARGGQGRLLFLAGDRVARRLAASEATLERLRVTLSTGDLIGATAKLADDVKQLERQGRAWLAEIAAATATRIASEPGPLRVHRRPDAEPGLLTAIANRVTAEHPADVLLLIGADGAFLVCASAERLNALRVPFLAAIGARGGGPPGRLQGRSAADPEAALRAAMAE